MNVVIQNIIRFFVLILVQVFVLNNIRFLGYINPYIYILFIFALPVRLPKGFSLILAFILGVIIDSFTNTLGMHTFATVLIAFLRNPVIKLFASVEEGVNPIPSFADFGVAAYVKYVISLVFIHHTAFFFLEVFSSIGIWQTLIRIVLNTIVTSIIILGVGLLNKK